MTSEITFYQTKITPKMNAKVDNILAYLGTTRHSEPKTFQYQKHALDLTVKLTMEQRYAFGADGYNYAKIKNSDDNKEIFYFVMDSTWTSQNCVTLILSMDTVNSFNDVLDFSPNTHITRQHKDRFVYDVPTTRYATLVRKVDKETEGINPAKFYDNNKTKLYDEDLESLGVTQAKKSKWYLIYKASQDLKPENVNNPIELYCTSDYPFALQDVTTGLQYTDYPAGTNISVIGADNPNLPTIEIKIGGRTYYLGGSDIAFNFYFESNQIRVTVIASGDTFTTNERFYMLGSTGQPLTVPVNARKLTARATMTTSIEYLQFVLSHTKDMVTIMQQSAVGTIATIDSIDRTNSQYMKIIELPYPPFEFTIDNQNKIVTPNGWYLKDGMFRATKVEQDFYRLIGAKNLDVMKVDIDTQAITKYDSPNIHYESKLYNSEFYDFNIRYDSFEKQVLLERFNATRAEDCEYQIMFKPSNTINSNFLFEFYQLNDVYDEIDINGQYLNVRRSNELPMYNSDYVEYIRNGYNYDRKNIARQATSAGVSFVAGTTAGIISKVAGSTGGFGVATAVSLISSAVTGLVSNINSVAQAEDGLKQKLQQAKNSPASVNGADDIDLLNYTTGNKLEVYTNSCTDNMKNAVWHLFRVTGYACNEYDVPNVDTRYWYNFIQCEPVFIDEEMYDLPSKVIDDIKARYSAGVTVYHDHNNQYDFEQLYENYETWLIRE